MLGSVFLRDRTQHLKAPTEVLQGQGADPGQAQIRAGCLQRRGRMGKLRGGCGLMRALRGVRRTWTRRGRSGHAAAVDTSSQLCALLGALHGNLASDLRLIQSVISLARQPRHLFISNMLLITIPFHPSCSGLG